MSELYVQFAGRSTASPARKLPTVSLAQSCQSINPVNLKVGHKSKVGIPILKVGNAASKGGKSKTAIFPAYFFRYASQLTPEEISGRLADTEFSEAAGVLEMIAQSPREREMYEARLKFERDKAWWIRTAKNEGLAEGRAEGIERGEYSGQIRLLQRLLGFPETPASKLAAFEIEQLRALSTQLQAQVSDSR